MAVVNASIAASCAHCRLPVPVALIDPSAEHQFCCAGCKVVFESVTACGLEAYYRLRDAAEAKGAPASPGRSKFEAFDSPEFQSLYVQAHSGHCSIDLALEGVSCGACVWLIEKLPDVVPGVIEARLSLRQATVRISWDPGAVKLSKVARMLDRFGYRPTPARGQTRQHLHRAELRRRLIDIGVAGALAGNLMLIGAALYAGWFGGMEGQYVRLFRWLSLLLGGVALAWPGRAFFRSAAAACLTRTMNIDVPIVMALLAGGAAGVVNVVLNRGEIYFDSLAALIFLLLVGRFIQFQQQRRAEGAVELLFSMTPATCRVHDDSGASVEIPVQALRPGQIVEVYPGELFPADGVVTSGTSSANLALLTGETRPSAVGPGDEVFGGTQNGSAVIHARVARCGQDSRIGGLMGLLEKGLTEKAPVVRFADRVGAWFVAIVSAAAVITAAFWTRSGFSVAMDHAVALVIVTCPCVLGVATPMTLAIAIGRLARRDVLVKSAAAIERLAAGGEMLLDKTGTLTEGRLTVVEWHGDAALRGLCAALESHSGHPVGQALHAAFAHVEPSAQWRRPLVGRTERGDGGVSASINGREVWAGSPDFAAMRGADVGASIDQFRHDHQAAGRTVVFVGIDSQVRAAAALGDKVRAGARASIDALRAMGLHPTIYSGDAQPVVDDVAGAVRVPAGDAHGNRTPEEKLQAVRGARGPTVMVGDGVNDAAALAAAGVGIAVHGGAEASLAAADVYVARPGLSGVVDLVRTSRRAMRVVRVNLAVSVSYNLLAGGLAMAGCMSPLAAAILMPLSSATVLSIAALAMAREPKEMP